MRSGTLKAVFRETPAGLNPGRRANEPVETERMTMPDPESQLPASMASGLSESQAAERLQAEGANEIPSSRPRTSLRIALQVLQEPMLLLLVVTGVVYLLLGSP